MKLEITRNEQRTAAAVEWKFGQVSGLSSVEYTTTLVDGLPECQATRISGDDIPNDVLADVLRYCETA